MPLDHVIRHYDVNGKTCPNPFVYNTGKVSWDGFKKMVKDYYDGKKTIKISDYQNTSSSSTTTATLYRVRKSWADEKSQLGAYTVLENAKKNCPDGYYVYDGNGKVVYPTQKNNAETASKEAKGIPASKQDYLDKVSKIAVELYKETKVLPSVVIAQTCLETGFGLGTDSTQLVRASNILGMKSELLNSTWSDYTVWGGESITKKTPEVYNGVTTYINDKFRVYKDYENCIRDYEMFLLNVKSGGAYKYRKVAGMTDPQEVITAISNGGYATDPSYITKVMNLINQYDLTKYDKEAGVKAESNTKTTETKKTTNETKSVTPYRVGTGWKNGSCVGQVGAYDYLDNAKKQADKLGGSYAVYDNTGKKVYPTATKVTPYRVGTAWRSGTCVGQIGAYDVLDNAKKRADEYGNAYYVYDNTGKQVYQGKVKTTKTIAQKAVDEALKICADNSHGYNNTSGQRTGNPDYACSSFVAHCYRVAGLTSIPENAYTASMYKQFVAAGFSDVTSKVNLRTGANTKTGDVVLRPGVHVEIVVNDKHQLAGARGEATGGPTNGKKGDQGGEIEVANWWDDQWTYCLRYEKDQLTATQTAEAKKDATVTTLYVVQIGMFSVEQNAKNLVKTLKNEGFDAVVEKSGTQYAVQLKKAFTQKKEAEKAVSKLVAKKHSALVKAVKS